VITRLTDLGGAHGYSQPSRIAILDLLTPADSAALLVHEFAHELLHQRGDDRPVSKTVRETEAEAVVRSQNCVCVSNCQFSRRIQD
jgi:hypothetical protein